MTSTNHLFSIGYAGKPIDIFMAQLQYYGVTAVADVRSVPYSKVDSAYHREALASTLKQHRIHYVYLGEELGPRSKVDAHYDECGQVQFDRLARSPLYLQGIARIEKGRQKGLCIALMCAEKDPADCHRSLLIGYDLKRRLGLDLEHITHDGNLETQQQMEHRLMLKYSDSADLFASEDQLTELGCQAQMKSKAYRKN